MLAALDCSTSSGGASQVLLERLEKLTSKAAQRMLQNLQHAHQRQLAELQV